MQTIEYRAVASERVSRALLHLLAVSILVLGAAYESPLPWYGWLKWVIWVMLVGYVVAAPMIVWDLVNSGVRVVLSVEGIEDRRWGVGTIRWVEIEELELNTWYRIRWLCLKGPDVQELLRRTVWYKWISIIVAGQTFPDRVSLNLDLMKSKAPEILRLAREYRARAEMPAGVPVD